VNMGIKIIEKVANALYFTDALNVIVLLMSVKNIVHKI
jgi:hypothetical protein